MFTSESPEPDRPVVRRPRRRRSRGRAAMVALPAVLGLLGAGAAVRESSSAAFSATTSNGANSWATGSVTLADDDAASVMFNAAGLTPGATGTKCIKVDYNGSTTAPVKLYVTSHTGDFLQAYLDMVIEEGTGGTFANCTGFTSTSTLATGTLASITAANTSHANGLSAWTPTGSGQTRTYRITYTLNASTPNSQQGQTATATFQWEARTP